MTKYVQVGLGWRGTFSSAVPMIEEYADCAHEQYIVKALEFGCDVITEKPMTTTDEMCACIILSTGASQFETLEHLVKADIDWSKVEMFHLDEYVDLPETHVAAFRKYLKERFVAKTNEGKAHFVDGTAEGIAALTEESRKGNPQADITILIATGVHCFPTEAAMRAKFGPAICDHEKLVVHNASDDSQLVLLGLINAGMLVLYNTSIIEAGNRDSYSFLMVASMFGGILVPMAIGLLFLGETLSGLQVVAVLMMLASLMLFKEKPTWEQVVGMASAVDSIVLINIPA